MGLFSLFGSVGPKGPELLAEARKRSGSLIVDVREEDEFAAGHIKDAINVPLSGFEQIFTVAPLKATPLYLYCASGARSGRAASFLTGAGYTDVHNMGGIRGLGEAPVR